MGSVTSEWLFRRSFLPLSKCTCLAYQDDRRLSLHPDLARTPCPSPKQKPAPWPIQTDLPGPLRRVNDPPAPDRLPDGLSYRVEDGAITALAIRHTGLTGLPD